MCLFQHSHVLKSKRLCDGLRVCVFWSLCCREVLSQQSSQGRFFEVTDVEVQHAQVLGASFLLPDAPTVYASQLLLVLAKPLCLLEFASKLYMLLLLLLGCVGLLWLCSASCFGIDLP